MDLMFHADRTVPSVAHHEVHLSQVHLDEKIVQKMRTDRFVCMRCYHEETDGRVYYLKCVEHKYTQLCEFAISEIINMLFIVIINMSNYRYLHIFLLLSSGNLKCADGLQQLTCLHLSSNCNSDNLVLLQSSTVCTHSPPGI